MLPYFDRLYPCSFQGASFFYAAGSKSKGRKKVIHEFPGKDFDFVEDLGKKLRQFSITGIITGELTYEFNRQLFETALDSPNPGVLMHPFYGAITCVCLDYTVNETISDVGAAQYEITFRETQPNVIPAAATDNITNIVSAYDNVYNTVINDWGVGYVINYSKNVEFIAQKMTNFNDSLRLFSVGSSSANQVDINTFNKTSNTYQNNIILNVSLPTQFATQTTNLVSAYNALPNDPQEQFTLNYEIYGQGFTDNDIPSTTATLIERNNDRKIINGNLNVLILANLYYTATQLTILNEQQLDDVTTKLEQAYAALFENTQDISITNTTISALQELRLQVRKYFDNQSLTINKITTINVSKIPVTVLCYQYYENLNFFDQIVGLNGITNVSLVSGNLKILSE